MEMDAKFEVKSERCKAKSEGCKGGIIFQSKTLSLLSDLPSFL